MTMTTPERAKDLRKAPALVSGFGARDAFAESSIQNFDLDFWYDEVNQAGREAFEMAGSISRLSTR